MSVVQHPNLVECYGGCTKKDSPFIVQELMQANISDILRIKTIALDLGIKLRVALDVAMGMSYLHNHCNLIHRDLKSLNLLASVHNDLLTIKVCDFGVSRVVDRRKTMTGNVGYVK
jgi:serine/threonine protein kinase